MNDELDPSLDLCDHVHQLLSAAPEGLSEYDLIQQLKMRHCTHNPQPALDRPAGAISHAFSGF